MILTPFVVLVFEVQIPPLPIYLAKIIFFHARVMLELQYTCNKIFIYFFIIIFFFLDNLLLTLNKGNRRIVQHVFLFQYRQSACRTCNNL